MRHFRIDRRVKPGGDDVESHRPDSHTPKMASRGGIYEAIPVIRGPDGARSIPIGRSLLAPYFPGMAMRRPTPSGTGRWACAAFILASRAATKSGNGATFFAAMFTLSTMFSEVAESQPSSA